MHVHTYVRSPGRTGRKVPNKRLFVLSPAGRGSNSGISGRHGGAAQQHATQSTHTVLRAGLRAADAAAGGQTV